MNGITIRQITDETEINAAISLVLMIFEDTTAKIFDESGRQQFISFIRSETVQESVKSGESVMYGAFDGDVPVGVITFRNRRHISLLFVSPGYHRRGIASALLDTVKKNACFIITVNAAPTGCPFYKAMGFRPFSRERNSNGLISTKMFIFNTSKRHKDRK